MRDANFESKIDELFSYPECCFGEPASQRWLTLCSQLREYQPRSRQCGIGKDRKWELVSALQKAIRRADKATALQLISGIATMPDEYGYFMRRMCVIACEDVGPADDILLRFTVACASVFSSQNLITENHRLLCFLAEQMCELPGRSRIYCSCETVSLALQDRSMPALCNEDMGIVDAISRQRDAVREGTSPVYSWQHKNNWRAAGLL